MKNFGRHNLFAASFVFLLLASAHAAHAASVTVVALGTSNTRGRGVSSSESYPAQLEAALKQRGRDVEVINMGINGQSSAEVLARVGSVPDGTALVLYEYASSNDRRKGVTNAAANMAALRSQLAARGIRSIEITSMVASQYRSAIPRGMIVMDAGPHLNGEAYGELVRALLPRVAAALRR